MPRTGIRVDHVGRNNMGIKPSGENTSITMEQYWRNRQEENDKPERKRAVKKRQSLSWGSE